MLLTEFLSNFKNAPKWARINVESVEHYGLTYNVITEEAVQNAASIIQGLKDDLSLADKECKRMDDELQEEVQKNEELEKRIEKFEDQLGDYQISPTDTLGELVERNDWQAGRITELQESLIKYSRRYDEDRQEIKDLRARKNKATVKRCLTTGRLLANFNGVEYILEKKN
jgi:chromosome segregation ATPase